MPAFASFDNNPLEHTESSSPRGNNHEGSESPSAPPYSPITPVMPSATLAPAAIYHTEDFPAPAVQFPAPVPISESENPDAIALRSAISVLQVQRQRTVRDLQMLDRQKVVAAANPEKFAHELASGNLKSASSQWILGKEATESLRPPTDHSKDGSITQEGTTFGIIPAPQNIVRCPPVNWAKYHVIGEALDNLHQEQRSRPTLGDPQREYETPREPEHVIAAPYRPWADTTPASPARTRSIDQKAP